MLTLNEYQQQLTNLTKSIKVEGDKTLFNCVGMAEEAGECLGKLKRAMRGEGFDREGYILELGDVLGYLAIACKYQETTLEDLSFSALDEEAWIRPNGKSTLRASINLHKITGIASDLAELNLLKINELANVFRAIVDCAYSNGLNVSLEEVMSANLQKLRDRLERTGTLLGSGDNR